LRLKPIQAAKEADYLSLDRHLSESIPLAFIFLVLRPKLNMILAQEKAFNRRFIIINQRTAISLSWKHSDIAHGIAPYP
jgi:hypothetical protein